MNDPRGESRERFVWPPRRAVGAAGPATGAAAEQPREIAPSPSVRETPASPAPAPVEVAIEHAIQQAAPVIDARRKPLRRRCWEALRSLIYEAERTWLDVRCPVLSERLAELGWAPDSPDDYCPKCGQSLGADDAAKRDGEVGCRACEGTRRPWTRIVRLGAYQAPLTRLIHEVKFTRWRRLGNDLGRMLGDAVAREIERERAVRPELPSRVLVAPVPSTFRRRLVRGIDHARVLAGAAKRPLCGRVLGGLLRRRHRPSQLVVLPSERVANMAGAIHPRNKGGHDLSGCLVVVVDDVTTTGATLRGACRAVHEAHRRAKGAGGTGAGGGGGRVEVWAAVVAVTELERED